MAAPCDLAPLSRLSVCLSVPGHVAEQQGPQHSIDEWDENRQSGWLHFNHAPNKKGAEAVRPGRRLLCSALLCSGAITYITGVRVEDGKGFDVVVTAGACKYASAFWGNGRELGRWALEGETGVLCSACVFCCIHGACPYRACIREEEEAERQAKARRTRPSSKQPSSHVRDKDKPPGPHSTRRRGPSAGYESLGADRKTGKLPCPFPFSRSSARVDAIRGDAIVIIQLGTQRREDRRVGTEYGMRWPCVSAASVPAAASSAVLPRRAGPDCYIPIAPFVRRRQRGGCGHAIMSSQQEWTTADMDNGDACESSLQYTSSVDGVGVARKRKKEKEVQDHVQAAQPMQGQDHVHRVAGRWMRGLSPACLLWLDAGMDATSPIRSVWGKAVSIESMCCPDPASGFGKRPAL
ncbi:uncharacterized protein J3D65DRAFT_602379 [Phyllosticta citribraziliensis]|uniref:Uncharacterized protein n=1 Tax=Phyllosticta citribraziliensis TaxID=989973 RepID=A0ABR1LWB0_9PEZI